MAQRRRSARRQAGRSPQPTSTAGLDPRLVRRRRPPRGPRTISKGYLVIGAVFAVAVLLAVLVNYWVSVKRPGDTPILQVNNRVYTWSEYVSVLKSQKLGADAFGGSFNAGVAPYQLMQNLAENELIRQAAAREGLRVTDAEIRAEMIDRLVPNADEASDPAQVERDLELARSNYLATTQLSRSQYRSIVEADLLRNQLRDKLGTGIPRVQPQVFLNLIKVPGLQEADEVAKRLEEGESFSRVARQLSTDVDTKADGGAVGWVPRRALPEYDGLLFGLAQGQVSDPIDTDEGVYLVRLVERVEDKARLQAILVANRTPVRDINERLQRGESFADLSAELSIDPELRARRGDLGLVGVGDLDGNFDNLIRGLPLNELSEPISALDGTVFVMVSDRTPALEVSEDNLTKLKTRALEGWLRLEWDSSLVNYCPNDDDCFSNVKVDKALAQIGDVSKTNFQRAATATAQARERASQQGGIPGLSGF